MPIDLSEYTEDPAAALLPYQDLNAADTWLFIVYMTPDGGALYGWVNAFYLQVYNQNGERQRLASLTPVPQYQLGGATNTDCAAAVIIRPHLRPRAWARSRRFPQPARWQ